MYVHIVIITEYELQYYSMNIFKKISKLTLKKLTSHLIHYLPLRLANDRYVPFFYVRPYRYITLITKFQRLRIKYWTSIASKYEPFEPFYSQEKREEAISDSSELDANIKNIYKYGYSVGKNFLDENYLSQIKEFTDKIKLDAYAKTGFTVKDVPKEIETEILENLKPYYNHFFPYADFSKNPPSLIIRVDYSNTGIDPAPLTANWHVDRFIPTLNAIFFPEGSNWGSFEKDIGNPVIDKKYIDYFSKFRQSTSSDLKLRESEHVSLSESRKLFDLPSNSLLIGTHHMQHRRSPYDKPGKRIAIFIDFYNVLPKEDLKKYANKD